jgi:hypothetical protein
MITTYINVSKDTRYFIENGETISFYENRDSQVSLYFPNINLADNVDCLGISKEDMIKRKNRIVPFLKKNNITNQELIEKIIKFLCKDLGVT